MRDRHHSPSPPATAVSFRLQLPVQADALLVLGHGAGSSMVHPTMTRIARALFDQDLAVLLYNFPYAERGSRRPDPRSVILATVRGVLARAGTLVPDLPLFAGGHSFGGRMTSTAQSREPLAGLRGLVFFSFPLHPAGKPATDRAAHLGAVNVPMLFLSGTRDRLADTDLLDGVCAKPPAPRLHYLDTADHGYRTLRRRASHEDVFDEMGRVVRAWVNSVLRGRAGS